MMQQFRARAAAVLSMLFTVWVTACGGGAGDTDSSKVSTGQERMRQALNAAAQNKTHGVATSQAAATALPAGVDAVTAADQLMDYAERSYPDLFPAQPRLFPGEPRSLNFEGYRYRFYPGSGIYLGVRDAQVYVMGGAFGSSPRVVGALTQFITPSASSNPALCAATDAAYATWTTLSPAIGKNIAAVVSACGSEIAAPVWRQTLGPPVNILSDRSQAIGFEASQAGAYRFEVSYATSNGTPVTRAVSIDVGGPAPQSLLTLRTSHAVRMGGKVSVRAWPKLDEGETVTSITWQVIDGPSIRLDTTDPRVAIFTAPEVERDTLVRLRATLRTSKDRVDADEAVVLIERFLQADPKDPNAMWATDHVPRLYAYKANSPYSAVLQACVFDTKLAFGRGYNLCPLAKLPFIGKPGTPRMPTVEEVMDRVLVSHDWLGRNFESLLRTQDPRGDFRRMLASVTSIVLSTQIRPSFYYPGTAAIYLDAADFWLTPEERDTLNEAPDYRIEFADGLKYANLWRYVLDGKNLSSFFDPEERVTRQMIDVRNDAAPLLYHELGHALDFWSPVALQNSFDWPEWTPWEFIAFRVYQGELTSDVVPRSYPLVSTVMRDLAQVKYQGVTASDEQLAMTPEQVGQAFASDRAVDEYSYSTPKEDVAMALEEFMMSRRLGARRDVAFSQPYTSQDTGGTIIVRWGRRGRIGSPAMLDRTRAIAAQLVPWMDPSEVDQLPPTEQLRVGESWRANLGPPNAMALGLGPRREPTAAQRAQFRKELSRARHHLHIGGKRLPPPPPRWQHAKP